VGFEAVGLVTGAQDTEATQSRKEANDRDVRGNIGAPSMTTNPP
jgi:hypothetical protein